MPTTTPPPGLLATALLLAAVSPGPLSANPPPAPPPFLLPPPTVIAEAPALPAASAARRANAATAHARWRHEDGGADFHPSLTYLRDTPVLMLITDAGESGAKALRRKRALVQAGGFLLDDTAFARAVLCVVAVDPARQAAPQVRNYDLRRSTFQAAARTASSNPDAKQALRQAREADAVTLKICADLGID